MSNDQHSSQGRRPQHPRSRRGNERRGPDRRTPPQAHEPGAGAQVNVEQIMRDVRGRIARRHGVDLTSQQIQELAARRLDAILDPQHVNPALMEQMRRAAAEPVASAKAATPAPEPIFDESVLYQSHRGFLRTLRRWLNPILKLFFNPAPIIDALNAQATRNAAAAGRETELYTRQAEWNALHYEILQRLILETSRTTIEMQGLAMRVESLAAKVDFNERRVRGLEHTGPPAKPVVMRPADAAPSEAATRDAPGHPSSDGVTSEPAANGGATENPRRRRRRRRGRRSGTMEGAALQAGQAPGAPADTEFDADIDSDANGDETDAGGHDPEQPATAATTGDQASGDNATALEPAHAFSLLQPVERHPSGDPPPTDTSRVQAPEPALTATPEPTPAPQPTPPRDEPVPHAPVDHAEPGPPER